MSTSYLTCTLSAALAFIAISPSFAQTPSEVSIPAAGLVCHYCLQNTDLGVARVNQSPLVLTARMVRMEPDLVYGRLDTHNGNGVRYVQTELRADGNIAHIPWDPTFSSLAVTQKQKTPGSSYTVAYLPFLVPAGSGVMSWRDLVKTEHACIGSQFKVPTFHFQGADKLPMAHRPYYPAGADGQKQRSAHFAELPSFALQTICEGKLVPVDELLSSYVREQSKIALAEFREATSVQRMSAQIGLSVDTWMAENRQSIAAQAAELVED